MRRRAKTTTASVFLSAALGLAAYLGDASDAQAAPSPGHRISGRGGNTGVGLSLGDPMGLSVKHFFHPAHALQFHLAWLPLHNADGGVGVDYLWTPGVFVSNRTLDFMPYLGLGVALGFDDDQAGLIIKPPLLGLAVHWKEVPFDTVLEGGWSPYIIYGPCSRDRAACMDLAAGDISIKARYYF
jgi:hypothetical protein